MMIKNALTILLTLLCLFSVVSFSKNQDPVKTPPLLTFDDLQRNDGVEGTFRIEGFVLNIYKCPPCPKGMQCKPCIPDNIDITDNIKEKDMSRIRRLRIFTDEPDQFELKKKYSFTVKIKGEIPKGQPVQNVELVAAKELPN